MNTKVYGRVGLIRRPTFALAAILLAWLLAPLPHLLAQSPDGLKAYRLTHARASDVEPQLRRMLAGFDGPTELFIDADSNQILVRGNAAAQQLAEQLLGALDRFQEPVLAGPVLRAYTVRDSDVTELASRMERQYAGQPAVRISGDPRTGQLLVVAPTAVHQQISQQWGLTSTVMAGAAQPAAGANPNDPMLRIAQAPSAAAPGNPVSPAAVPREQQPPPTTPAAVQPARHSHVLRAINWAQAQAQLGQLYGPRLISLASPQADMAMCQLTLPGQEPLLLMGRPQAGEVTMIGPAGMVERGVRLLAVLDATHHQRDGSTRIVQVADLPKTSVQRTIAAVHTVNREGGDQRAAARARVPVVAQLFQAQAQVPPNQPGVPADAAANAADDAADDAADGGLIGPVQIEFLDGLDVMIISGNQRDVERVVRIIEDIERLSVETEPAIEVHQLNHVGSEAIATIVTQLYDQVLAARQGRVSITPLVKPNALLLIGRQESVNTILDLVERLDQPVDPLTQFAVFPLKRAPAATAQVTLQEFFADRQGLGGTAKVTADYRSNSLIVQASPRDLAEAAELIQRIDTSTSEAVNQLRVIPLRRALAEELAQVLQAAISGQTGAQVGGIGGQQQPFQQQAGAGVNQSQVAQARSAMLQLMTIDAEGQRKLNSGILTEVTITADPRGNALLVSAPPESMDLIEALIRQLDEIPAAEAQIKVFTIVNGDAASLRTMLEALFGQRTQAAGGFGAQAPITSADNLLVPLRFSVDDRTNSVIASGSGDDLRVVEAILLRLDESDARQRKSIVYRLKNAPAIDVSNAINQFLSSQREIQQINPNLVSPFQQIEREVVVVPEPVSNSLVVSATPRYFEEIRELVDELDARPPMVMLQLLIAEVTLNNTDEFGVELGLQDSILFDRSLLGDLVTTTNSTQTNQNGAIQTVTNQVIQGASMTPGFGFNNQPLGNSGSDLSRSTSNRVAGQSLTNFSVGRINGDLGFGGLVLSASSESVSILIRALKECRRLDVLSRPQIMTLDNQPAFIQVGARVPRVRGVETNQVGQTSNVVDENVGLILGVTPRISPDGLVVMEIDAEKSALGPESEGVPISISATGDVVRQPVINTTTAQATISAANGQTVVLGGLITKTRAATRRRVPLLSEIPILGNLFRYDLEAVQKTELLIILTPHIVRTEADAELIRQVETARMSWIMSDVRQLYGEAGLQGRGGEWSDEDTIVIYPDQNPAALEEVLAPPSTGEVLSTPEATPGLERVPALEPPPNQ